MTLAIKAGTGDPAATLSGTTTVAAVAGVATFSGLSIDKAAAGYQLHATDGALTAADSNALTISPAAADHLTYTQQPASANAGSTLGTIKVAILDSFGNQTSATTSVTLAIKAGTGDPAATLSGTTTVAAVAGVATFSGLSIDKAAAGYQLHATDGALTAADSNALTISPAAADHLAYTQQPASANAGATLGTIKVAILDSFGNQTSATTSVTLAIKAGTGDPAATLSGTTTVAAVAGVATFSGLSIDKAAAGYKLTATDGALTAADSNALTVSPAAADHLAYTQQPNSTSAGASLGSFTVSILDQYGNQTSATSNVTLALKAGTGDPAATLSGTTTVAAVAGVASFSGLSIDKAAGGYQLRATDGALTAADSNAFTISAAAADHLSYAQQPSSAAAGGSLGNVTVSILDQFGNLTSATSNVTLAIKAGTGDPAARSPARPPSRPSPASPPSAASRSTRPQPATSSRHRRRPHRRRQQRRSPSARPPQTTSPTRSSRRARTPARRSARSRSRSSIRSATRRARPRTSPSRSRRAPATPPPRSPAPRPSPPSPASPPSAASRSTRPPPATSSPPPTARSPPPTATPSRSARPRPTTSPTRSSPASANAGATLGTIKVAILDAYGNQTTAPRTSRSRSSPAPATRPRRSPAPRPSPRSQASPPSAASRSTRPQPATSCTQPTAPSPPPTARRSRSARPPQTTSRSPSSRSSANAGATLGTIKVAILDAYGNQTTRRPRTSRSRIKAGTGDPAATLSGTTTVAAVNGLATLSGLTIDKAAAGYKLTATDGALTTADSSARHDQPRRRPTTSPTPSSPARPNAGAPLGTIKVAILDAYGNQTTDTTNVTLALKSGTGDPAATLSGTTTVAAVNGLATFTGLTIDKAAAGYELTATDGALTTADSNALTISAAAADHLAYTQQPGSANAGASLGTITVAILDQYGNQTTDTSNVTLAIKSGTGDPAATLTGTTTLAAVNGLATFSGLSIDRAAAGYQLHATDGALTAADSSAFVISPAGGDHLAFTQQPGSTASAGASLGTIEVAVRDQFGNAVSGAGTHVTIAIATNPGSGSLSGTTTEDTDPSGVATFTGLSINKAATGYTLDATATSPALTTNADSSAFTISPAAADHLAYTQQPGSANAGATLGTIKVAILDQYGNQTTDTSNVTLAIKSGTGDPAATLSGTTTVAAVNGLATFTGLTIDKAYAGYQLHAVSGTLHEHRQQRLHHQPGRSRPPVVHPAAELDERRRLARHLHRRDPRPVRQPDDRRRRTSPSRSRAAPATPPPPSPAPPPSPPSTASPPSAASRSTRQPAGTRSRQRAAPSPPRTAAPSRSARRPPTISSTRSSPSSANAGATLGTIKVAILDQYGNQTTDTTNVTLAIKSGTGDPAATLSGTTTVAAVNGLATFSGLSIDKAAAGYELTATDGALTAADSNALTISAAAADHLSFTQQPGSAAAGASLGTIEVAVRDQFGNAVSGAGTHVTIAIATNPGSGSLSGTTTEDTDPSGVATFTGLSIDKAATGYTLDATATSPALTTNADSSAFTISPAAADHVAYTQQPGAANAGATLGTIKVAILDAYGNQTTDTSNVTLAIKAGTGDPAATLSGTTTVAAVARPRHPHRPHDRQGGRRLPAARRLRDPDERRQQRRHDQPGQQPTTCRSPSSRTRRAPAPRSAPSPSRSSTSTATRRPTRRTSPSRSRAAPATPPPPSPAPPPSPPSTASPPSAASRSTRPQPATSSPPPTAPSRERIAARSRSPHGAADHLSFVQQPATTPAASTMPDVTVALLDQFGNQTSDTSNVTIAIKSGTGDPAATLSGTTTVAAVAGVATFGNLSIDKPAAGYQLTAADGALTGTDSAGFTIGAPTFHLSFTQQPNSTSAGASLGTFTVAILDQFGNATSDTSSITVAIKSGTGDPAATLSGTKTVTAVNGVATFSGLSVDKAAGGYQLHATSGGFTSTDSAAFTVGAAAADHLVYTQQPASANAGATLGTIKVAILDAYGNQTTATTNVALALKSGTGDPAATLSGTTTVAAVTGLATFSGLSIDKAAAGYQLHATDGALTTADSNALTVSPAAADHLAYTQQPASANAGATLGTIKVAILDQFGNATGDATSITLAIKSGSGNPAATLTGTTTVAAVAGVATFSGLSIDRAAAGYELTATDGAVTGADSAAFTVGPAVADHLVYTQQPASANAGATLGTIKVAILDQYGNQTTDTTNVALALKSGTGDPAATLSGTTTVAAVNGLATFSGLTIDKAAAGYQLHATDGDPHRRRQLRRSRSARPRRPPRLHPAARLGERRRHARHDQGRDPRPYGNQTTDTTNVTLALKSGTGDPAATLTGTTTVAATAGVATFTGLSIDKAATGYTLTATDGALTADSNAFTVSAAAADHLAFTQQPGSAPAGGSLGTITIAIRDQYGNETTDTSSVTLAIKSGTGDPAATLSGTTTVAAVNGLATLSGLSIDKAATGYTLTATDGALTTADSNAFDIVGAPTLAWSAPSGDVAVSGTTLYYRPASGASGSATLTAGPAGKTSYAFPDLGAGWTPAGGQTSAAASVVYAYNGAASEPGTVQVTYVDGGTTSPPAGVSVVGDGTAPSSTLNGPADGSVVAGATLPLTATASDAGAGLRDVSFFGCDATAHAGCDPSDTGAFGTLVGTDSDTADSSFGATLDTTPLVDGHTYRIVAQARDRVGNTSTSPARSITVDNSAPSVAVLQPSVVGGGQFQYYDALAHVLWLNPAQAPSFALVAQASDGESGIAKVRFPALFGTALNDQATGVAGVYTSASYTADGTSPGAKTITAFNGVTTPAAGTAGAALTIQTDGSSPAAFSLGNPNDGAGVRSGVTLSAAPSDTGSGVGTVDFVYCDRTAAPLCTPSTPIGATQTVPVLGVYSVTWSNTGLTDGHSYAVAAVATDMVGNATASAVTTVVVDNSAPTIAVTAPVAVTGRSPGVRRRREDAVAERRPVRLVPAHRQCGGPGFGHRRRRLPGDRGLGCAERLVGAVPIGAYTFSSPVRRRADDHRDERRHGSVRRPPPRRVRRSTSTARLRRRRSRSRSTTAPTTARAGTLAVTARRTASAGPSAMPPRASPRSRLSIEDRTTGLYYDGAAFTQASPTPSSPRRSRAPTGLRPRPGTLDRTACLRVRGPGDRQRRERRDAPHRSASRSARTSAHRQRRSRSRARRTPR